MNSERLIRKVTQTAALEMASLRGIYERCGLDVRTSHPVIAQVVQRLKRFATLSKADVPDLHTRRRRPLTA